MDYIRENGCIRLRDLVVGPRPSDEVLAYSYLEWKREGTLHTVWMSDPPEIREYLEWLNKRDLFGCWRLNTDVGVADFLGMGFVANTERMGKRSKAEIGFIFHAKKATLFEKIAMGRMLVEHVFVTGGYDAIFGTTPERNPAAVAYAKRLGFAMHGPIKDFCAWDGELCGVWISQMSRPVSLQ